MVIYFRVVAETELKVNLNVHYSPKPSKLQPHTVFILIAPSRSVNR